MDGMNDRACEKPFNAILRTALVVVNIYIDDHCHLNVYNSKKCWKKHICTLLNGAL